MSDFNDDAMERLAMEREEDGMLQHAENERADQHPGALRERSWPDLDRPECATCGLPEAMQEDYEKYAEGEGEHLCWGDPFVCTPEVKVTALTAELASLRAELEAVKNERDLAVLTLAAFTPADKPNQGAA